MGAGIPSTLGRMPPGAALPPAPLGFFRRHLTAFTAGLVLLLGLAIRVSLVAQDRLRHVDDTDMLLRWTKTLGKETLARFYETRAFCDYPPLFVLVMWAIGKSVALFDAALSHDYLLRVLLKTPACLADLTIALALLAEGRRLFGPRRAIAAAALYFLNPVAIYNSAYWGQVDAIHAAFLLGAVAAVGRGWFGLAGAALGLALLQKFQSIALVPLIIFEAWQYRRWRGLGLVVAGVCAVAFWLLLPFGLTGTLDAVLSRAYVRVAGQYNELSPSAFNLWQLIGMQGVPDTSVPRAVAVAAAGGAESVLATGSVFLWITWRRISLVLFAWAVAIILSLYSYRPGSISRYGAAGLLALAFFFIPTEMHERYAHPAIALLPLWALARPWRERAFCLLSALLLLNLTFILPVTNLAGHIAGAIGVVMLAMLMMMAWDQSSCDAGAMDAITSPFEPVPTPSHLIRAFRWATYAAPVPMLAVAFAVAHSARASHQQPADAEVIYMSDLKPVAVEQGRGELKADRSVRGGVMHVGDRVHLRGLGTHAPSKLIFEPPSPGLTFHATVGIDRDTNGRGSAIVVVELDGREVYRSPILIGSGEAVEVDVPLGETKRLTLQALPTSDGPNRDHVDWAAARLERE
jgi:Gpi18-like mannosyltransferase